MGTSTIPLIKRTLISELCQSSQLNGVQVTYGHPGPNVDRESLFIGGSADWDQEWAALGANSRNEQYSLAFYINVQRPGDGQQDATERTFELLAALEDTFRDNATVDSLLLMPAEVMFQGFDEFFSNEGRETQIVGSIRCRARI